MRGARRFHVQRTRVRDNGLIVADVDWRDDRSGRRAAARARAAGDVLQRILEQVGGEHGKVTRRRCFDDAAWVGWRLAELLPLDDAQRQALLQHDDPHARLDSCC